MRKRVWMTWMLLIWLVAVPAAAQETRGTISGTVRDKDGVLPGATVKITNTGTNVSQPLVTNDRGYFEAPLLIAGEYEVSVELASFKSFRQTGIQLAGRPIRTARHHARSRQHDRTRRRGRLGRAPRHECRHLRSDLREPPAERAADVLRHAAAARFAASRVWRRARRHNLRPRASSEGRRRRRARSAAWAPPNTPSTARRMPATRATWLPRRTPTCCRRCASKPRISMLRWDTARGSASR